ncbi:unnamed protein product, partial [Soboliphyme baturini]|uniref:PFU domain-containing protein n=1 Tax=Soboliphyme baturini TaxID=241478 RepID=A0A183IKE3_9BILA
MFQLRGRYDKTDVLDFHKSFVSSVVIVRPSLTYPKGLIISGSYDNTARIYSFDNLGECRFVLGHDDVVSTVQFDEKRMIVVTGCLNGIMKTWRENDCLTTVEAHSSPIWAVAVVPDSLSESPPADLPRLLTASADKTIRLWEHCMLSKTFTGHTDCVRGLQVLSENTFLSCSNDHSVRQWNLLNGECLMNYTGHTHFVYSVCSSSDGSWFASASEDHTVRVWNIDDSTEKQVIKLPCQTIWCVLVLDNGDIACGSRNNERLASKEAIEQFNQHLNHFEQSTGKKGAIDWDQLHLPGPEALNRIGTKDAELMLIRVNDKTELYQWSESGQEWSKAGEAVESLDMKSAFQKTVDNKAYDYVFDIDVEDGKEPLKLPFNKTDDPWLAAQQFISRHSLPQYFLQEVAQFIIDNVPDLSLQKPAAGCLDPFTGESCYTTGSNNTGSTTKFVGPAGDPFTGSRYIPSGDFNQTSALSEPLKPRGEHMPLKSYIVFQKVSADALLECLVPVMDLMRLVFLEETVSFSLSSAARGRQIIDFLHGLLDDRSVSVYNQLRIVVFRCFANIFHSETGRSLMLATEESF